MTDEDMFAKAPDGARTIHIGGNRSRARFRLGGPEQMTELLSRLAEESLADCKSLAVVVAPNCLTEAVANYTQRVAGAAARC